MNTGRGGESVEWGFQLTPWVPRGLSVFGFDEGISPQAR